MESRKMLWSCAPVWCDGLFPRGQQRSKGDGMSTPGCANCRCGGVVRVRVEDVPVRLRRRKQTSSPIIRDLRDFLSHLHLLYYIACVSILHRDINTSPCDPSDRSFIYCPIFPSHSFSRTPSGPSPWLSGSNENSASQTLHSHHSRQIDFESCLSSTRSLSQPICEGAPNILLAHQ